MGAKNKWMAYILVMHPKNRLRELRKRAKITQSELAKLSGVSQPAISQIENDERPLTVDWMRTFARIFGCTTADLLDQDDNPHRLTDEERELLEKYRQADETQRAMVQRVAEPIEQYRAHGAVPIRRA